MIAATCGHLLCESIGGACAIGGAAIGAAGARRRVPRAALERELLRRSFGDFVRAAFPLATGRRYAPNVASEAIIAHLQAIAEGRVRRLAVAVAPGLGKSTLISVLYPAWRWARDPSWRVITASHAHDLAVDLARKSRRLVEGEWFRGMFGVQLADTRGDHYSTTSGGHRIAVGVGGALTGFRALETICDDPLNAIDARSKATRATTNEWHDAALATRLDDPERAAQIVVQQRLHSDDLIGHLAEQGGWELLVLPSEYDARRPAITSVWRDPRTRDGELIAPEIHSAAHLAERRATLGTAGYSSQYLQSPTDDEGGLFRREWWRFHKPDGIAAASARRPAGCTDAPATPMPSEGRIVVSLDAAFKDLKTSDNVCFLVARIVGAQRYILERRHGKMSFSRTKETLVDLAASYRGATFLVEDKANGTAILDALRVDVPNLIPISPKESKEARAAAVSPGVEAGQVFLPDGAPWLSDFVEELAAFPRGKHDDQVDALSQLLGYLAALDPTYETDRANVLAALFLTHMGRGAMTLEELDRQLPDRFKPARVSDLPDAPDASTWGRPADTAPKLSLGERHRKWKAAKQASEEGWFEVARLLRQISGR